VQWCLELLKPERQNIYQFYQLELGDDGTTYKRTSEGRVFHPILAPYLICDLLEVYRQSRNHAALTAAIAITDSAVARGESFLNDSLVFWYHPEDRLSSVPGKFYSGLTQAWYIRALCRLVRIDARYSKLVARVFNSFSVPIEQGGVLLKRPFGWIVEEYPHSPAFYTLNGWLTVLRWLAEDRETLRKLGCQVDSFLEYNLDAVEHLLPLYDLPSIYNTRYQLTGFVRVQLLTNRPLDLEIRGLSVSVPGENASPGNLNSSGRGRWSNHVERAEPRLLQFNVVLSMISDPIPNSLEVDVVSCRAGKGTWRIAQGDYDPLSTGLPTGRWQTISSVEISPGENRLTLEITMGPDNLIAYPTNFKKKVHGPQGLNFNGYHFVHVLDLAALYHRSGRSVLKEWSERWLSYVSEWPSLPYLPPDRFSHQHYSGVDFERSVRRLLDTSPVV
jgi:hypothetical protein